MVQFRALNIDGPGSMLEEAYNMLHGEGAYSLPHRYTTEGTSAVTAALAGLSRRLDAMDVQQREARDMLLDLVSRPVSVFSHQRVIEPEYKERTAKPGSQMWIALQHFEYNPADERVLREIAEELGISHETVRKARNLVKLTTFDNNTYTWKEPK